MEKIHQLQFSPLQAVRLLTLVCFFHFSGVNNGITCMVMSGGRVESVSAGSGLARWAGRWVNPARWAKEARGGGWKNWVKRSGRVIEIASQQAVENLLVESTLAAVFSHPGLKGEEGKQARGVKAEGLGRGWGRESVARVRSTAEVRSGELVAYLNLDYEESWLKLQKMDLWRGHDGRFSARQLHAYWRVRADSGGGGRLVSQKQFLKNLQARVERPFKLCMAEEEEDSEDGEPEVEVAMNGAISNQSQSTGADSYFTGNKFELNPGTDNSMERLG